MAGGLNYAPEDVRTSEAMVASISGSGVAFAFMPHNMGEEPQIVAIAPKIAKLHDIRIGDTIEVGYVENFPEHLERVRWRAVAIYKRTDGADKAAAGIKPTEARKTIEDQVLNIVMGGTRP